MFNLLAYKITVFYLISTFLFYNHRGIGRRPEIYSIPYYIYYLKIRAIFKWDKSLILRKKYQIFLKRHLIINN